MMIAGDIGGTKTNLALFDEDDNSYAYSHLATYRSRDYPDLKSIVENFIFQSKSLLGNKHIASACFAVAGPVINGVSKTTNLPWIVSSFELAETLKIPKVLLINDLEANAASLDILSQENLLELYPGKKITGENKAVISPGTGLGEAGLIWTENGYIPFACEGGHCDFGPRDDLQLEFCRYLIQRFGHASYERVLSGPGLFNTYMYYRDALKRNEPTWLSDEMKTKDPAAVISQHALDEKSDLCVEALNLFCSILGSEAGNCVLKFKAFGGVYLGGGIPPKILPKLKEPHFFKGFIDKGRFKEAMQDVPIYVILDDKSALRGAAYHLRKFIRKPS